MADARTNLDEVLAEGSIAPSGKRQSPASGKHPEDAETKRSKADAVEAATMEEEVPLGLVEQVVASDSFLDCWPPDVTVETSNMEVDMYLGLDEQVIKSESENSDNSLDSNANIARINELLKDWNRQTEFKTKKSRSLKGVKASIVNILDNWYDYPTTHALGKLEESIPPPHLVIDGFGYVPLPVNGLIAKELIKYMERSPYGHGEKTITDPEYRNSYQIGPEMFQIENQKFTDAVNKVVETVAEKFYFSPFNVSAQLYKFLLYEPGGLFKPHKDTEKENGMFATLIIQLPSVFTGSQFRVEHNGKIKTFDLSEQASYVSSFYIAHFASCTHELTRIESGYRTALVYNLCWTGNATHIPLAPSYSLAVAAKLRQMISAHLEQTKEDGYPGNALRLVWLLEHDYTDKALKTLGHKALKGQDAFVVKQLMDTNKGQSESDLFQILLAEATKRELGNCDIHYCGDSKYDWYGHRDKCEMGRDFESEIELKNFICLSRTELETGALCRFERLAIDPEEDVLNFDEDEAFWGKCKRDECEGYTGNAGAPMERWYSRRVLVVYFKADERKIAFLENADRAIKELLQEIECRRLTHEEKECVLSCKFTEMLVPNITLLAYKNADLYFVKQVVMKISKTNGAFGSGSQRRGCKGNVGIYGNRYQGPGTMEQNEDETGLTRCLKLYKARGNIDDLEPYLVSMIRVIGESNKEHQCHLTSSSLLSMSEWGRAEECLRVVDEILPTKDVYGHAIYELFFERMTHHYYQYSKENSSRIEKALKFLMIKYPDIIPGKWETMVKSSGMCHPTEAVWLIPSFQTSNLEMKNRIVERILVGVLELVVPEWIESSKRTGYSYYSVVPFQDQVQKLTEILVDERLIQLVCEKFALNAELDCVANWIDWVFDKNIQQLINSPHFRHVVESRIKALKLRIAGPIPELGDEFRTKKGEIKRTNAAQKAVKDRNEKIEKRNKLMNIMNKLADKLKSMK